MFGWFKKQGALPESDYAKQLSQLLAQPSNREEFLGVKQPRMPGPDDIRKDAAKLTRYSESSDYKVFANEAWGRIISHLDSILDSKSNQELVSYHRGALKATLDLLRLSYQARSLMDTLNHDTQTSSQS